ncbi:MAG: metal ABC transporter substrate-binding protein [Clostridiales bacterium]|nr:metal ABC transporter substrate-binding protein [Clostridiales bacterium]
MKLKRFILIISMLLLTAALFSGCSENDGYQEDKINIVCTTFPQYDWVRQIIGEENMDKFHLTFLINNKIDLHNYNPSVKDIVKIKKCEVFIYVGGESDDWVNDVLKDANPNMIVINLIEVLGDLVIRDDHDHGHDEDEDEHDGDEDEHGDEHVWLSLKNAKVICAEIAAMLSEVDPDGAQAYEENFEAYAAKLSALDAAYQAAVDAANVKTLVFADRFPFLYLMEDYGLDHFAAFHGCSTETEASLLTIMTLANEVDRRNLKVVMVTESSDKKLANQIIRNTKNKNQKILVLDAIQSVTSKEIKKGTTYLSIMESNLNVLKEALK